MATVKTATKTTKKPEPKKKAATLAFRTDYKPDTRVKVTRRGGDTITGRVVSVFVKKTGPFIKVNVGTKDKPLLKDFRPRVVRSY